jgi:hypothetical protein
VNNCVGGRNHLPFTVFIFVTCIGMLLNVYMQLTRFIFVRHEPAMNGGAALFAALILIHSTLMIVYSFALWVQNMHMVMVGVCFVSFCVCLLVTIIV